MRSESTTSGRAGTGSASTGSISTGSTRGTFRYNTGDTWITARYDGETVHGEDTVLLDEDDDLTAATKWADDGFTIVRLLDDRAFDSARRAITDLIAGELRTDGHRVPDDFDLEDYHRVIGSDDEHLRLMTRTRGVYDLARLPFDLDSVLDAISVELDTPVTVLDNDTAPACFGIRIVRPNRRDHNPPHRDVWLDGLRNAVNIYLPLAGSTPRSALPLIRGSHHWSEDSISRTTSGSLVDGIPYVVPAVIAASRPLVMERPDPPPGHATLFSPYLIHGGARNLQSDATRVSVEMRFMRHSPHPT